MNPALANPEPKKSPKARAGSGDWIAAFLATLRASANVTKSCKSAGVARQVAYARKASDPEFAEQWRDALEDATDALEEVARNRAKKSSNSLLMFLLRAHRPEKYKDRMEFTSPHFPDLSHLAVDDLARIVRLLDPLFAPRALLGGTEGTGPDSEAPRVE